MAVEKWELPIPEGARLGVTIPKGLYIAEAVEVPTIVTSSRGSKQIRIILGITEGEFAGRTIALFRPIESPRAWRRLERTLRAFKVPYEIKIEERKLVLDPLDFLGKKVKVLVGEREFEGRVRSRVEEVFPYEEGTEELIG